MSCLKSQECLKRALVAEFRMPDSVFKERVEWKLHFHYNTLELRFSPDRPHALPFPPEVVLLWATLLFSRLCAEGSQAQSALFLLLIMWKDVFWEVTHHLKRFLPMHDTLADHTHWVSLGRKCGVVLGEHILKGAQLSNNLFSTNHIQHTEQNMKSKCVGPFLNNQKQCEVWLK